MNKQNTEFVKLETWHGEKFFRRDAIVSFGYKHTVSTTAPEKHEVRIVYQTSDSTSEDITYLVYDKSKFEQFRDSILDASRKTPAAPYDDVAFQDRFPDGIRETPEAPAGDTMAIQCQDGNLNFSVKAYMESSAVRDFIDTHPDWIASHSMRDVADELEELYMK